MNVTATHDVLAVLITKADSACCDRTLQSLFTQSLLPSRLVIGVIGEDTSTIQGYCDTANPPFPCHAYPVGKAATFFEAINSLDATHQVIEGDEKWLWFLHEDSAPELHCLQSLVDFGNDNENTGIVGAKQVMWEEPTKLVEVGIRATRSARRIPDIAQGEYDQGQYDRRHEVLAVGSAGMLVKRDALEKIGGLEEKLGPFGDGLELSRRMRAGGYDVLVCPHAKVRHKQASLGEDKHDSYYRRRKAQLFNGLLSAPTFIFPFQFLAYLLGAFPRAFARLLKGEAALAAAEIRAPYALLGSLGSLFRARQRLKKVSAGSRRQQVGVYEDSPRAIRAAQHAQRSASRDAADMEDILDPLTEKALRENRRSTRTYAWIILAVTALATFFAHVSHIAVQATGGALLPDSSSFGASVRTAASSWLASGDGYAVPSDIFWAFLAPFTVVTSQLGVVATWIIFLGIIGAAFSAYIAAGDFTTSPPRRAIAAIIWAFAPPLLDSVNAGQVAGVLVHIIAPLAFIAFRRAWKGSLSALAVSSLLAAFLSSAAPIVLPLVLLAGIVGFFRHTEKRWLWLTLPIPGLVLLAPALFALIRLAFVPTNSTTATLSAPWRFLFSTPGAPLDTQAGSVSLLSFSPLSNVTVSQLLTFDVGALARVLLVVIMLVIAIMALMRPSRYRMIRLGWIFIAFGWAWALVASSVSVGVVPQPGQYTLTHGWSGIALSFAFLGVWIVVLAMTGTSSKESEQAHSSGRSFARIGLNSVAFVSVAAALISGGVWVVSSFVGSTSLISPASANVPALALADEESSYHSRVLALDANGDGLELELWRGDGVQLHETSMLSSLIRVDMVNAEKTGRKSSAVPYGTLANEDLAGALASLASDSSSVPQVLAQHGVSVVLVPEESADSASRTLIGRLNSVRDLEYITSNETGSFWRVCTDEEVSTVVSRLRLEAGGNTILISSGVFGAQASLDSLREQVARNSADTKEAGSAPENAAVPSRGRLVLAERADSYWHAELVSAAGRQELKAVGNSWNQQWELPLDVDDAEIVVYYGSPVQRIWAYIQLAVMICALLGVIVLPKKKRERYE